MKVLIKSILIMLLLTVGASQSFAEQKITFYHYDLLGSPVATTDENGAVTWREEYSPWGEKLLKEDETHDNVRGYTGHVNDKETGLTYMQARYYDPQIGRFMGVDPVGFQENNSISFNRYGYANNNPYGFTDPNGESPAGDGLRGDDAEHEEMIGNMKDQAITDPSQSGAIDLGISLIPGMGVKEAFSDYNKGNYGMAILGVASEAPWGKGLKLSKGTGLQQSLTERAADLVKRNDNKNRVSISTPTGRTNIDLAGKPHNVNGIDVPTPHVQNFKNNTIPSGPRAGQVGSRSKQGNTREATAQDLRTVDRFLKSKGQ